MIAGPDALFAAPVAPEPDGVRLVLGSTADACSLVAGAALVHADPPWIYGQPSHQETGVKPRINGDASGKYDCISNVEIASHLDAAWDAAAPDCYLVCWCTWPKLAEWLAASSGMRWRYVTGGSWHKTGRIGTGFHVRGDSEFILIYVKGKPRPRVAMSNAYASARGKHSEKPVPFLRRIVEALARPSGPVLDLYAGLAPLARACREAGREYVGIEIDPQRRADALALLAQHRMAA